MEQLSSATSLSQNLLYAVKTESDYQDLAKELCELKLSNLRVELSSDPKRIAFWLNIYNAFTQIRLKDNPELYAQRQLFYQKRQICVAGESLSLNEIEHGILRKLKTSFWLTDFLGGLFASSFVKTFQLDQVDPRIHFALNCGATSCPPIRFYEPEKISSQLDIATRAYLAVEVAFDTTKNIVTLPALFQWFQTDFGGKNGVLEFLRNHNVLPMGENPKIVYRAYDWNLKTGNFETK